MRAGVKAVLLDIEGTTTPIAFVYETLFPFARRRLEAGCARAATEPAFADAVALLRAEHGARPFGPGLPRFGDGAPYARHLMNHDVKSTGLKALQGLIWEAGYREGELKGEVFDDVPPALKRWKQAGLRTRIYSSGSILAQKLLFGHSTAGDLLPLIEDHHDTTTGPKREQPSYETIAAAYGLPAGEILFCSDVTAELDAARGAGMQTLLLRRPGNKPTDANGHDEAPDFSAL